MLVYPQPVQTDGCSGAADGLESEAAAFAGRQLDLYSETVPFAPLKAALKTVHPNPEAVLFHPLHIV